MNRLHTLLAATDLSAPSRHAAQRAAMLARQTGARFELLHVLKKSALDELRRLFGKEGEALAERTRLQSQEALGQFAADIGAPPGVVIGRNLREGPVLETIIQQADLVNASLVIVGARGTAYMRHWVLGATADRLLRKTLRPILCVKQPAREPYRSVLVPVDFSPWSLDAIRLAQEVAPRAEFILLHAYEAPLESKLRFAGVEDEVIRRHRETARREAVAGLHQIAAEAGIVTADWRPLVIHGDAAPCILEQEEEQGADLIVLGKHMVREWPRNCFSAASPHMCWPKRAATY